MPFTFYLIASGLLLALWLSYRFYRQGKVAEQHKTMEQSLHDLQQTRRVQDRLHTDPAFAQRVRQRFTRR